MPDLSLLMGAATGAQQTKQNIDNFALTEYQNYGSRKFAREMYERQYNDNLAFWRMQNEYNSPAAQVQRYRDAGLNPALIYGSGGSAGNASGLSAPSAMSAQFRVPEQQQTNPLLFLSAIYDLDMKQAQIDNLKAQNTVIKQDALLKTAQTAGTMTSTERQQFDLALESELRQVSADARREQLRQLTTSIDVMMHRDVREAVAQSSSLREAAERILTMQENRRVLPLERERVRQNIEQLKKDNVLRDLDIELRRQGINPNDPMWSRIAGRLLSNLFTTDGFKGTSGNIWKFLFK